MICLASVSKYTVLPIVVIDVLHGPQWVSGVAMIIGTAVYVIVQEPVRQKLPRTRRSRTFSFRVADCHGYVTVGEYEDGAR